jgi:hypothetical protein
MSTNKDVHEPMTEEEAQKEYEDIQAEIARGKGQPSQKKDPEEKVTTEDEPDAGKGADDKGDDDDKSRNPDRREVPPKSDDPGIEPDDADKGKQTVPLSKYQETKKTLEGEKATLATKVEELTAELNKAKTAGQIGDKVKSFSDKHGIAEEAVLDLVQLVRGESELDPGTKEVIKKAEISLKKQEAEDKFSQELAGFFADTPEAKDYEAEMRAKAFEKGNLDKSLFEIFHRFVKPADGQPKKKTGEANRGATRQTTTTFDPAKTAEGLEKGTIKINSLTTEQQDQVFDYMEKTGSRYTNNR